MAFDLTQAQKNEINGFIQAHDYVGGYGKILDFISDLDPQTGEVSPTGESGE